MQFNLVPGDQVSVDSSHQLNSAARLLLRRWRSEDLASFAAMSADPRVMEKLGMSRDPADDFLHPGLPVGHALRPHVLNRKRRVA
jgi:hypothetical protein